MTINKILMASAVAFTLSACTNADPEKARARLGLPPIGFVADIKLGEQLYRKTCAACHGVDGGGSPIGPPLIHKGYAPKHHADLAFFLAIRDGVRQHHWSFGDMPAQPYLEIAEAGHIVGYVRSRQKISGLY